MRMRNGLLLAGVVTILGATSGAGAQAKDSLYHKAQEMVANGDPVAGRALLDSLMHASSPDSVSYADGLYWHAVLAQSAADAELDYRRIIVDYPTSPRVEDALVRIGQLELTRGEYDEALQHLRRVPAEHPSSPLRAKASYWIARTLFEKHDLPNACAANADAAAYLSPSDVELKNQIDYQQPQCRGVAVVSPKVTPDASASAPVTAPKAVASASKSAGEKKHAKAAPVSAKTTPKTPPPATPAIAPPAAAPPVEDPVTPAPAPAAAPDADQPVEKPTPKPVADKSADRPPTKSFTVQVAAYYDSTQAAALATKLQARGYTTARVDGAKAPYRVRLGHFPTHAAAAKLLATLKAKKMTGFVAEE